LCIATAQCGEAASDSSGQHSFKTFAGHYQYYNLDLLMFNNLSSFGGAMSGYQTGYEGARDT
jgi:hypothetical protein